MCMGQGYVLVGKASTDTGGGLKEACPGWEWKLQPEGFLGAERTAGSLSKALDWEGFKRPLPPGTLVSLNPGVLLGQEQN